MDKMTFLKDLADKGYSRDEAEAGIAKWRSAGRGFDDDPKPVEPVIPEPEPVEPGLGEKLSGRGKEMVGHAEKFVRDVRKQPLQLLNPLRTGEYAVNVVGEGAGGIGDIMAAALKPLSKITQPVGKAVRYMEAGPRGTPRREKLEEREKRWGEEIAGTLEKAEEEHPQGIELLKNALNIAGVVPLGQGVIGGTKAIARPVLAVGKGAAQVTGKVASALAEPFIPKKAAEAVGLGIQRTVLKPTAADLKDGLDLRWAMEHKISGSPAQMKTKAEAYHELLSDQLNEKIGADNTRSLQNKLYKAVEEGTGREGRFPKPGAFTTIVKKPVDLRKILDDTMNYFSSPKKIFGESKQINSALKEVEAEFDALIKSTSGIKGGGGKVDLYTATQLKRAAGRNGAWSHLPGGPHIPADAIPRAKVWDVVYAGFKKQIEKNAPDELKHINAEFTKLIPIERAALRREAVRGRQEIVPLKSIIGLTGAIATGQPLAALPAALNALGRSGSVAQKVFQAGQAQGKHLAARKIVDIPSLMEYFKQYEPVLSALNKGEVESQLPFIIGGPKTKMWKGKRVLGGPVLGKSTWNLYEQPNEQLLKVAEQINLKKKLPRQAKTLFPEAKKISQKEAIKKFQRGDWATGAEVQDLLKYLEGIGVQKVREEEEGSIFGDLSKKRPGERGSIGFPGGETPKPVPMYPDLPEEIHKAVSAKIKRAEENITIKRAEDLNSLGDDLDREAAWNSPDFMKKYSNMYKKEIHKIVWEEIDKAPKNELPMYMGINPELDKYISKKLSSVHKGLRQERSHDRRFFHETQEEE